MILEHQVCAYEQARALKALGISQLSYFLWSPTPGHEKVGVYPRFFLEDESGKLPKEVVSAYNVAELGIMLPSFVESYWNPFKQTWECLPVMNFRAELTEILMDKKFSREHEAQARCMTLLFLLNQSIITPETVNSRLKDAQEKELHTGG